MSQLDSLRSYSDALASCKSGCLRCSSQEYFVTNDVWECNQIRLKEIRKNYSSLEKDKVMKQALYNKLKDCTFEKQSTHVKLQLDVNFIIDGETSKTFSLCEGCYVRFNDHICERTWKEWKCAMKKSIIVVGYAAEASAAFAKQCVARGATKTRFRNIAEAREALMPLGYTDEEHFQLACIPDSTASREAYLWMFNFFSLIGDNAPNRKDKIQLPGIYTKQSIHHIYHHHITTLYSANEHEPLGIRAFEQLWHNIFPNVTISKYCQVSGKCYSCHALYERQELFTCESDLRKIRELATIHKIMIEMQRGSYIHNRQMAQERPDMYMSLIIDGMSQDHCILPYYAGEDTDSAIVKQKIVGAKQHGIARTFYRLFPHVQSGANVACEVLLQEIKHRMKYCIDNNTNFPRCLLLQIDGGPENTAKVFYGLVEHLVRIGIFDRIEVSRLPVGHTHEDIDAMFGVLWRAAQGKTIITPQQWKAMAIAAFNQDNV